MCVCIRKSERRKIGRKGGRRKNTKRGLLDKSWFTQETWEDRLEGPPPAQVSHRVCPCSLSLKGVRNKKAVNLNGAAASFKKEPVSNQRGFALCWAWWGITRRHVKNATEEALSPICGWAPSRGCLG